MELWIRSQDRELLVLCKGFELQHTRYDNGCQIFAVWENNYQLVGKYKDKTRALEILDEIHNILQPRVYIEQPDIELKPDELIMDLSQNVMMHVNNKVEFELKNAGQIVYQMPKE